MNSNAIAGPSHRLISTSTSTSSLLPPTLTPIPTIQDLLLPLGNTTPSPLSGSQDLLTLFNLKGLYDTYVRPSLPPVAGSPSIPLITEGNETKLKLINGSGSGNGGVSIGFTMGGVRLGGIQEGSALIGGGGNGKEKEKEKGGKRNKIEKSYAHLVEDIPGRNTIRKDTHLNRLILNPDAQPFQIKPFNPTILREAFTLQTGQIPGFDTLIWESEDPNAPKKKKKKRKHDLDPNASINGGGGAGGGDEESRKKKRRKGSETYGVQDEV